MTRVVVWGTSLALAVAIGLPAIANAQQPAQPGQAPALDPGLAQPAQPGQQATPVPQPGIETRQNIMTPGNRFGQQRGANLQGGIADPPPTAAETPIPSQRPQQPLGQTGADTARNGTEIGNGRNLPGELGVWLVASSGPGVEIRRVTEGSAAAQAGLQQGDVILQVNGRGAASPQGVAQMIRQIPAGQAAMLEVWRDGATNELEVVLQPARETWEVGFRGEAAGRSSAGLASRTRRMEEQLSMVMQELQRLREEVTELRAAGASQPAAEAASQSPPVAEPGFDELDQSATQSVVPQQPAETLSPLPAQPAEATAEPDAFDEPTSEPAAEPADEPATEPADDANDDLFGASDTADDAATTDADAATDSEPAETETESDADSGDLFQ